MNDYQSGLKNLLSDEGLKFLENQFGSFSLKERSENSISIVPFWNDSFGKKATYNSKVRWNSGFVENISIIMDNKSENIKQISSIKFRKNFLFYRFFVFIAFISHSIFSLYISSFSIFVVLTFVPFSLYVCKDFIFFIMSFCPKYIRIKGSFLMSKIK